MAALTPIRRALISVSDKTGLVELAQKLHSLGVALVASGGTYAHLREHDLPVQEVKDLTQSPEILGGRVKTLHPRVHGGILARRGHEGDAQDLSTHGITPIDLVVVNLYPFEASLSKTDLSESDRVELIDIGGVALLRAAAKNFTDVVVIHSPDQYSGLRAELETHQGQTSLGYRRSCAASAFARTQAYDHAIASWMAKGPSLQAQAPETLTLELTKAYDLRYGENPHQKAAFYVFEGEASALTRQIVQGKTLSYNNLLDLHHGVRLLEDLKDRCACAILKHNNPCGVAVAETPRLAFERALSCDPVSSFGGIVGFSREVDEAAANACTSLFLEAIVAPSFSAQAKQILSKKKNLRLLELGPWKSHKPQRQTYRSALEGVLVQDIDRSQGDVSAATCVTKVPVSSEMQQALGFAWSVCRHVKSNAIVLADREKTLGIGAGQMSRIDSVDLAGRKMTATPSGPLVLASDAFFPFRDGVDHAAKLGVRAIIQPGGSIRDEEVIQAANEHGMAMVMTKIRHFSH